MYCLGSSPCFLWTVPVIGVHCSTVHSVHTMQWAAAYGLLMLLTSGLSRTFSACMVKAMCGGLEEAGVSGISRWPCSLWSSMTTSSQRGALSRVNIRHSMRTWTSGCCSPSRTCRPVVRSCVSTSVPAGRPCPMNQKFCGGCNLSDCTFDSLAESCGCQAIVLQTLSAHCSFKK